ncbi:hypothetical protein ACFFRR_006189 [Megaselia abdita]
MMVMSTLTALIFGIFLNFTSSQVHFPKISENVACLDGETCTSFRKCEVAFRSWKQFRTQPKSCYFKGKEQFVCCPRSTVAAPKIIEQTISEQKCGYYYPVPFVIGGVDAIVDEFLFMAALRYGAYNGPSNYLCGGMLISPNFVLTAAHCISVNGIRPTHVRIGGEDLSLNGSKDIKVKRIIVHPEYSPDTSYNDIALLELSQMSENLPACLWSDLNPLPKKVIAIGYGHKEFAGEISKTLQKVNLTLFRNSECSQFLEPSTYDNLPNGLLDKQICAGELVSPKDTCQGDSGGPIFTRITFAPKHIPYLIGITSFGSLCASGVPAVYTRISEFRTWIEGIVWND